MYPLTPRLLYRSLEITVFHRRIHSPRVNHACEKFSTTASRVTGARFKAVSSQFAKCRSHAPPDPTRTSESSSICQMLDNRENIQLVRAWENMSIK